MIRNLLKNCKKFCIIFYINQAFLADFMTTVIYMLKFELKISTNKFFWIILYLYQVANFLPSTYWLSQPWIDKEQLVIYKILKFLANISILEASPQKWFLKIHVQDYLTVIKIIKIRMFIFQRYIIWSNLKIYKIHLIYVVYEYHTVLG